MAIKGFKEARKATKEIFEDIRTHKARRAVVEILIAGRSYVLMLTPIDTGNLANSAFIDHRVGKASVFGRFGFTADYAAAVHGMPGTLKGQPRSHFGRTRNYSDAGPMQSVEFGGGTGKGNYWDPGAEPEFVEKGFDRNKAAFDAIVAARMKI